MLSWRPSLKVVSCSIVCLTGLILLTLWLRQVESFVLSLCTRMVMFLARSLKQLVLVVRTLRLVVKLVWTRLTLWFDTR